MVIAGFSADSDPRVPPRGNCCVAHNRIELVRPETGQPLSGGEEVDNLEEMFADEKDLQAGLLNGMLRSF